MGFKGKVQSIGTLLSSARVSSISGPSALLRRSGQGWGEKAGQVPFEGRKGWAWNGRVREGTEAALMTADLGGLQGGSPRAGLGSEPPPRQRHVCVHLWPAPPWPSAALAALLHPVQSSLWHQTSCDTLGLAHDLPSYSGPAQLPQTPHSRPQDGSHAGLRTRGLTWYGWHSPGQTRPGAEEEPAWVWGLGRGRWRGLRKMTKSSARRDGTHSLWPTVTAQPAKGRNQSSGSGEALDSSVGGGRKEREAPRRGARLEHRMGPVVGSVMGCGTSTAGVKSCLVRWPQSRAVVPGTQKLQCEKQQQRGRAAKERGRGAGRTLRLPLCLVPPCPVAALPRPPLVGAHGHGWAPSPRAGVAAGLWHTSGEGAERPGQGAGKAQGPPAVPEHQRASTRPAGPGAGWGGRAGCLGSQPQRPGLDTLLLEQN